MHASPQNSRPEQHHANPALLAQQRQMFSAADGRTGAPAGASPVASQGAGRMLLCGDIGGTKVLLAIAEQTGKELRWRLERRYMSKDYPHLSAMLADFMRIASDAALYPTDITGGCLAVAGPIDENGRRAQLTNLPWKLDASELASTHGTGPIRLVNDFAAAAAGIDAVAAKDLVELQAGSSPEPRGPRLVIGAGTGLGMASMLWQGGAEGGYRVMSGEGGHVGFAPTDETQADLWKFLHAQGKRVSNEHIASGPGLVEVYRFFAGRQGTAVPDDISPKQIGEMAAQDVNSPAGQALGLFFRVYGAAAGDLALALMPRGGVYVAGGIAARMLGQMQASGFVEAFNGKPPHEAVMQRFPIRVVTDLDLGLKGAARIACGAVQV